MSEWTPEFDRHDQGWLLPWENPMRDRFKRPFFRGIPNGPGVYIMLDGEGQVIYVGKSCRLRERLLSYRSAHPRQDSRKVLRLVSTVCEIRWEPCKSDEEACIRENFLLRNYRPPFNVMNTRPFTYFFVMLEACAERYRWRLTLDPGEADSTGVVFGAYKGRRMTKLAYQALLRLQWVHVRGVRTVAQLSHPLVIDKAPRDFMVEVGPTDHAEMYPLVVDFLRGESDALVSWFEQGLDEIRADLDPFLVGWMERELEVLAVFYERTLQEHKALRELLPHRPDIIPQEKVDDLLLMHKNARPNSN